MIVVGGRPAGASLAVRLGQQGWRVLLLDRSNFPSAPAVSYPAIFPNTMALLDELGVDERDYARNTLQIHWWINEFRKDFRTRNRVPRQGERDYAYAIDRARFDAALWRRAERCPGVTTRPNFAATDLLWQDERVHGVRGRQAGGAEEVYTADYVIGADGRFSLVARQAGAARHDERIDLPTSVLYAYWSGVEPYDDHGAVIHVYAAGYGYGCLLMDSADGTVGVGIYGQSTLLEAGDATTEAFYLRRLREQPRIWRRLRRAERVTDVRGMRRIGNMYRSGGGPGWALVGDALHQVDPMHAQGIFDALSGAKALSAALHGALRGKQTWEAAITEYEAQVKAETHPRYVETLARIRREIFTRRPDWAWKTYIRWLNDDPEYKRRLALMMTRGMDAAGWLPRRVIAGALLRGAADDLRRRLVGEPRGNALPALVPADTAAARRKWT